MDVEITKVEYPQFDLLLMADLSEESISDYIGRATSYVARWNRKIVGQYLLLHTRPFTAEVINIAVLPFYRRKGVGTALLHYAIQTARKEGYKILEMGVAEEDKWLIEFYEKFGFVRHAVEKDIIGSGVECRNMVRLRIELR
jgi:ribosomal protein S18 acetylase RimI-like enzyme